MTDFTAPAPNPTPSGLPDQGKPWWQSRTVLGALAVIASQAVALIGLQVDPNALTELALQGIGLVGGILALWGRIDATAPIAPLRTGG